MQHLEFHIQVRVQSLTDHTTLGQMLYSVVSGANDTVTLSTATCTHKVSSKPHPLNIMFSSSMLSDDFMKYPGAVNFGSELKWV